MTFKKYIKFDRDELIEAFLQTQLVILDGCLIIRKFNDAENIWLEELWNALDDE